MSIERLRKANPGLTIRDISDPVLAHYGRIIDPAPFAGLVELEDRITTINPEANTYVARLPELEADPSFELLRHSFGQSEIQVGYCNGPNSKLNAVEWHKSTEIDIAVTDLLLLLGKRSDIDEAGYYDSRKLDCFYFPKGCVIELLPEVLHFSPCRARPEGFKSIIVLPLGTNTALEGSPLAGHRGEPRFLFMKNKWLIAHPERAPLVDKGAFPGILGENIEIRL